MSVHYTPLAGRAGDVIPYAHDGVVHVFYLRTPVADETENTTAWYHVSTRDLVTWTEHGEAIGRGPLTAQDSSVATGSIVERDGVHHAFYTGFSAAAFQAGGGRSQGVLRATSTDLLAWTKDSTFTTLLADEESYERNDWRDPFVWQRPDGRYEMLLAGRRADAPIARAGVVVRLESADLDTWELVEPLWEPALTTMHECPDLFQIGPWWYLIYSTFTERQITRYRKARSPQGPWLVPADDALDDDGLYAAKTAVFGERRVLVGWCPDRTPATDAGAWTWGGSLVVHEVVQRVDGDLGVQVPVEVVAAVPDHLVEDGSAAQPVPWPLRITSPSAYAAVPLGAMAASGTLGLSVLPDAGTSRVGVLLHTGCGGEGYSLAIDLLLGEMVLDRTPRPATGRPLHSRPLVWDGDSALTVRVVWDGPMVVAQVGDVVLTARCLDHTGGELGVFVSEGAAVLEPLLR